MNLVLERAFVLGRPITSGACFISKAAMFQRPPGKEVDGKFVPDPNAERHCRAAHIRCHKDWDRLVDQQTDQPIWNDELREHLSPLVPKPDVIWVSRVSGSASSTVPFAIQVSQYANVVVESLGNGRGRVLFDREGIVRRADGSKALMPIVNEALEEIA